MLLPEQLRTFSQSVKQPGQWAAHLIRGVDIPVACYTCTETLAQIYQRKSLRIENRQEKKDILPTAGRERKREGGKEGRKEDGRKKKPKETKA